MVETVFFRRSITKRDLLLILFTLFSLSFYLFFLSLIFLHTAEKQRRMEEDWKNVSLTTKGRRVTRFLSGFQITSNSFYVFQLPIYVRSLRQHTRSNGREIWNERRYLTFTILARSTRKKVLLIKYYSCKTRVKRLVNRADRSSRSKVIDGETSR